VRIGGRLNDRLNYRLTRDSATNTYHGTDGRSGEIFIFDAIIVIGLRHPPMQWLASSLEECVIESIKKSVHLFNVIGNV
jgi:hypothetical protein